MDSLKPLFDIIGAFADFMTIIASGIAIWVFTTKRKELSAALKLLLNYSYQTTLAELKEKLERLNEYHVGEKEDIPEIRNIFHEIAGQIRGNARLMMAMPDLADKIEALVTGNKLNEPRKRSIVSEIRELLKNIHVGSLDDILGEKQ